MDAPRRLGICELAEMAKRVQHVVINYGGESYEFPWMELAEKDMPAMRQLPKEATKEEQLQAMNDALDDAVFRMIRAGSIAEDGVEITAEQWKAVPGRLRRTLTMAILDLRADVHNDFLR